MAQASTQKPVRTNILSRYLPILGWLPAYRRDWLRLDVLAGLTVVALLVPEGMAYAELAGMPPETAFYAAIPALILYALFGTSKQLVVATSSTIAAMSASVIAGMAPAGTGEFILLTSALAILAGLFSVAAGLFRLGSISQFFSESVLTGFVFGLALVIAIKQIPKLFGLEAASGNFWERLLDLIQNLSEAHLLTLVIGLSSLGLMLLIEHRRPKVPAALVTLVYGIAAVTIFNLEGQGVNIVGDIPAGLVGPKLPGIRLDQLIDLIAGAAGIALVAFAEAIGPARDFASQHRYKIDADQELIAIGTANIGAGIFQGYSIGASLSKSAANDNTGAKSGVSLLIAAGATALVALFLTSLFYNLPEATLAAIVVVAILGMMNVAELKRYFNLRRTDFWLAVVALFAVLTFEILIGLFISVALSLLVLIKQAAEPKLSVIGRAPGRLAFGDIQLHSDYRTLPGLMIVRPNEELWFANATPIREDIVSMAAASEENIRAVLLDLEMTYKIDIPTLDMIAELNQELERSGVALHLAKVHKDVSSLLEKSGLIDILGKQKISRSVIEGVITYVETRIDFSPEEAESILLIMPHVRELISLSAVYAEDDQEKERLQEIIVRLEDAGKALKSAQIDLE